MKKNILDFFEETIIRFPQKKAIIEKDKSITFQELHQKSCIFSKVIKEACLATINKPIAVLLPKSINAVITDIAISYSCNIFMNLDIKTPDCRLSNIINVIKPCLIITNDTFKSIADAIAGNVPVRIIDDNLFKDDIDISAPSCLSSMIDTDPFCIINTSGSTGTPKGVVLNHKSFIDFMQWSINKFSFDGNEIIGALSPIVFDIYEYELCLMMFLGSSIVLIDGETAAFPARLLQVLQQNKVNFIFWVPSIMVNISNMKILEKIPLPDLRTVWFAGEVFPTKQFNYWRKHLPFVTFANLYGPIEITLDCTYFIVNRDFNDNEPLPIGHACENTDIILLNEENKRCKPGEIGEICVRGTSLAMGYYNNPEKTALAFVQNPLNDSYPELIYRTGDLAYENEKNEILFKGRKDSLIKHMGYRIELGEIEHVIVNTLKLVKYCCAVYRYMTNDIVLFYEAELDLEVATIKKKLSSVFPRYMIPNIYCRKEELPRNTNGKIDRLKLKEEVN